MPFSDAEWIPVLDLCELKCKPKLELCVENDDMKQRCNKLPEKCVEKWARLNAPKKLRPIKRKHLPRRQSPIINNAAKLKPLETNLPDMPRATRLKEMQRMERFLKNVGLAFTTSKKQTTLDTDEIDENEKLAQCEEECAVLRARLALYETMNGETSSSEISSADSTIEKPSVLSTPPKENQMSVVSQFVTKFNTPTILANPSGLHVSNQGFNTPLSYLNMGSTKRLLNSINELAKMVEKHDYQINKSLRIVNSIIINRNPTWRDLIDDEEFWLECDVKARQSKLSSSAARNSSSQPSNDDENSPPSTETGIATVVSKNPNENAQELDSALQKLCERAQMVLDNSETFHERLLMCIGMNMFKNNAKNQQIFFRNSSLASLDVASIASSSRKYKQKKNYELSEESC